MSEPITFGDRVAFLGGRIGTVRCIDYPSGHFGVECDDGAFHVRKEDVRKVPGGESMDLNQRGDEGQVKGQAEWRTYLGEKSVQQIHRGEGISISQPPTIHKYDSANRTIRCGISTEERVKHRGICTMDWESVTCEACRAKGVECTNPYPLSLEFPSTQTHQEPVEHRCGHIAMVQVWNEERDRLLQIAKIWKVADCPSCANAHQIVLGPGTLAPGREVRVTVSTEEAEPVRHKQLHFATKPNGPSFCGLDAAMVQLRYERFAGDDEEVTCQLCLNAYCRAGSRPDEPASIQKTIQEAIDRVRGEAEQTEPEPLVHFSPSAPPYMMPCYTLSNAPAFCGEGDLTGLVVGVHEKVTCHACKVKITELTKREVGSLNQTEAKPEPANNLPRGGWF